MVANKKPMDAKKFSLVASSYCKKWSKRSLEVVRALLVEGVSLDEAALTFNMKSQQASVLRGRFYKKEQLFDTDRVQQFMEREKPKLLDIKLEPFLQDILTLRDKGYSNEQIIVYLKENGIHTTLESLENFIRSFGHENNSSS